MLGYLFLAAAVGATVYLVTRKPGKATPPARKGKSKGGNWCAAMYKENPKGQPKKYQRLSHSAGPFDTKAEAEAEARKEKAVWWPRVRKCTREDLE